MNMSKMTPGPWEEIPQTNGNRIIARVFEDTPEVRLVAQVMIRKPSMEEDRANAQAIAALPELVTALREIATNAFVPSRFSEIAEKALKKAGYLTN